MFDGKPQTTEAGRFGPMMLCDGEFLCAQCVLDNRALIDDAAHNGGTTIESAQWAAVGYCGDKVKAGSREVKRDGGTRQRRLLVNNPEVGDRCAHCNAAF